MWPLRPQLKHISLLNLYFDIEWFAVLHEWQACKFWVLEDDFNFECRKWPWHGVTPEFRFFFRLLRHMYLGYDKALNTWFFSTAWWSVVLKLKTVFHIEDPYEHVLPVFALSDFAGCILIRWKRLKIDFSVTFNQWGMVRRFSTTLPMGNSPRGMSNGEYSRGYSSYWTFE